MRMSMREQGAETGGPDIAVVEAPTAQGALEQVSARFGARADILGASRVLRGGLGGFFAKEMIQLRVRTGDATAGADAVEAGAGGQVLPGGGASVLGDDGGRDDPASPGEPRDAGQAGQGSPAVARLLSTLTGRVDERERTFARALRDQLSQHGMTAQAPSDDAHVEPRRVGVEQDASPVASPVAAEPVASVAATPVASVPATPAASVRAAPVASAPATPVPSVAAEPVPSVPAEPVPVTARSSPHFERSRARQPLAPAPVAGCSAATASGPPRHVGQGARTRLSQPAWQADALEQLGLPRLVRDALAGVDGDMACLQAVAAAVATLCRPLPTGVPLLVGPEAGALSPSAGMPLVMPPGPAPAAGPVAAAVGGAQLDWVERVRGDRWLHLVVGGSGWAGLAEAGPLAVSWACAADLPAALRLAADGGLVLGYDGSRGPRRASPVDIAVTLREMVVGP